MKVVGCRILMGIILGSVFFIYGFFEFRMARASGDQPEPISVAELEKGPPANPYRVLGEHVVCYESVIYSQNSKTGELNYVYYPITTTDERKAVLKKLLAAKGNDPNRVTSEDIAAATVPRVLVRTHAFKTKDELQDAINHEKISANGVSGLVINEVAKIGYRESDLLKDSYKGIDPSTVVIFEVGRAPSKGVAYGFMGAGVVVWLLFMGWAFFGKKTA